MNIQTRDGSAVQRNTSNLDELSHYRYLLRSIVVKDIKVKYQRSMLGLIWTLLNPLLTITIFIAIFSHVIRIQMNHYWAFLISGYFVWNFIQQNLLKATSVMRENSLLNRSVYFPREILILGTLLTKLVEFMIEFMIVLVLFVVFYYHAIPPSLILLPWLVAIMMMMTVGLMFPLAVIATYFQDIYHAMPIVIMSLFYLTPVFYPVDMVPVALQPFFYLNPLAGLIRLFHIVVFQGEWPTMTLLVSVSALAMAVCILGYIIFNRNKDVCVEIA